MPQNSLRLLALFAVHIASPNSIVLAQTVVPSDIVTGDVWLSPTGRVPLPLDAKRAGSPGEAEIVTGDVWILQQSSTQAGAPAQRSPDSAQAATR
jgi:hypothetical protein